MKSNKQQPSFNLKRICALCIVIYMALVILLYFLMGHQLHFRESRGDIALPVAEAGTVELAQGAVLEQTFSMEVQRLQEVSVQWGTYYRPNSGTATMELYNPNDGSLVLSKTFDVSQIQEGGRAHRGTDQCTPAAASVCRLRPRRSGLAPDVRQRRSGLE